MLLTEWNDDEYREVIREEAIAEGIAKGRAEERAEVARGMKADGEPIEKIVRYTGLQEETIAAL